MNVESANVSPLLSGSSAVDGASLPMAANGVIPEGFSDALLGQIELLVGIRQEGQPLIQVQALTDAQSVSLQNVAANLLGSEKNVQELAALLGKDLPVTEAISNADNYSATLDAVTDTLKYIAAGNTAEEKTGETGQNMKDVIALAAEAEQNMKDVIALAAETDQGIKDVAANVSVQMDASQASSDLDKKAKNEGQDQSASAEDTSVQEAPVAAIILPSVVLTEQTKIDNNVVQNDAIKDQVLASFVKPLTEGGKLSLSRKDGVSGDASLQEANLHQPAQDKQGFSLKYFENAGQAEKTGQIERQSLSLEGDKVSSRVGDIIQLNRPATDNKADMPALAKPLSHPEWSKDLGDRIAWMNSKAIPAAEIKMNPQHLGPISVRIDVNQDHQANIVFTAQHAVVREAIEASIPKLREMMSAQQLDLVGVNVSQNSTSGQGQPQPQNFAQMADDGRRGKGAGMIADGIADAMDDVENGQVVVSKGILSIYA